MNWYKKAQNQQISRQQIMAATQFFLKMIQQALEQNPQDSSTFIKLMRNIGQQNGSKRDSGKNSGYYLPQEMDPTGTVHLKFYPKASDGATVAEAQGNMITVYVESVLKNPQNALNYLQGKLVHELAHVYEEVGGSPDEEIENGAQRTIQYLGLPGEINSHAWEYASLYSQAFPGQPFNINNVQTLVQQYSNDVNINNYLVSFADPEKQVKYQEYGDIKSIYENLIAKMKECVDYLISQQAAGNEK